MHPLKTSGMAAALSIAATCAGAETVQGAWAQIMGSAGPVQKPQGEMPLNLSLRFITDQSSCPAYQITATKAGGTQQTLTPAWQERTNRPATQFDGITLCQTDMAEDWVSVDLLDSTGQPVSSPGGTLVTLAGAARATGAAPRVVAFGDTGCRGQFSSRGTQNCDGKHPSETGFFFGEVASDAMKQNPDFAIHLGDYRYDREAVKDWDNWNSDFFSRITDGPLMQVPWAFVRGNHETCDRAGHGWYYFFGPNDATITCSGMDRRLVTSWYFEVHDTRAQPTAPHRFVFVGTGPGISKHDLPSPLDCTAIARKSGNLSDKELWEQAVCEFQTALGWSADRTKSGVPITSWFVMHRPIWGLDTSGHRPKQTDRHVGEALQAAIDIARPANCKPYDANNCGLKAVLAAHEHMFTNVVFRDNALPQQIVVGHSGVKLDGPAGQFVNQTTGMSFAPCRVSDMDSYGLHHRKHTGHVQQYRGRISGTQGNGAFGFLLLTRNHLVTSGWDGTAHYIDKLSQTLGTAADIKGDPDHCSRP